MLNRNTTKKSLSDLEIKLKLFFKKLFLDPSSQASSFVKFARYVLVGGISWMVDFGFLYFSFQTIGLSLLISASLGFCLGLVVNFFTSIKWVFGQTKLSLKNFNIFIFTGLVGLVINDLVIYLFASIAIFNLFASKVLATLIVLCWNFIGRLFLLRITSIVKQ